MAGTEPRPLAAEVRLRLDAIDAAIYADLFDCAVTIEELWRYSRVRLSHSELAELLDDEAIQRALCRRDGLHCLSGRERLLARRPERRQRARKLRRRARRIAPALSRLPFVRGLMVTGSAAADDAAEDADLDLLVLVERDRLGTTFALLGSLSRLLGRRLFCPNHYVAIDSLPSERRDRYTARELAQARPLCGAAAGLIAANAGWVNEELPNACLDGASGSSGKLGPGRLQRLLERPLRGRGGSWLERRGRRLAQARLEHHYGGRARALPESVRADLAGGRQLRFHAGTEPGDLLERYERRRGEVAELLG